MKFAGIFVVAAGGLLGLSGAAPQSDTANGIVGFNSNSGSLIAPFSEKLCNDLTDRLCRNNDGYWMRYSVYDPATGTCVCSTKPSDYMVCQSFFRTMRH